jgi:hypothetical protein
MFSYKVLKISVSAIIILSVSAVAWGKGDSDPRAVGMGGAYTALARDLDAPGWNPANLGLSDGKGFSMNLFSLGLRFRNNSFSLADYNRYNGKFLEDSDKQEIINSIPERGLSLDLAAEASALNFSIGNFALTYKGLGASSFSIDRDPFKLLLLGNAVMKEVKLSDTKGEAYAVGDIALSYGQSIHRWTGGEVSVGGSLHYLRGLAYEKIMDSEGGVSTTDTGFVGSGFMRLHSSLGGTGYSSDLGMAVRFEEHWFFSAVWQNIASQIRWNRQNKETYMYFNMQPITFDNIAEDETDSLMTSGDSTYDFGSFTSRMTPTMRLGLARVYSKLTWSVDWEQSFFEGPGVGVNPHIACGFEYRPWNFLPLRTGLSFGGNQGSQYSLGLGFHFGPYNFDLGAANSGSPSPTHTKGARIALSMSLRF